MNKYALLVGINKYDTLGRLSYAKQDAEAFGDVLQSKYGFLPQEVQIMTCGSDGVSYTSALYIVDALDRIATKTDLDLLVFGFWGHGFHAEDSKLHLCASDTLRDKLMKSTISLGLVKEQLTHAGATNTWIVLDCCRNIVDGRSVGGATFASADAAQLAELARDLKAAPRKGVVSIPTVAIINSCQIGQQAYEWEQRQHGVFTAHLLDAMSTGERSVSHIVSSIAEQVTLTAESLYHQKQVPFTIIEGKGDIVIDSSTATRSDAYKAMEGYHPCPECGFYNQVGQTFRCIQCGREYLCRTHYDSQKNMCNRCAALSVDGSGSQIIGSGISIEVNKTDEYVKTGMRSLSIDLTFIKGGSFLMGSDFFRNQQPIHRVTVSDFSMGTCEVTQYQYEEVMQSIPSRWKGSHLPVDFVSWYDAVVFANKLSRRDGLQEVYTIVGKSVSCDWSKRGYRLPTESEWEYVALGGNLSQAHAYAGSDEAGEVAWYMGNSGGMTHEVGTKKANELGLYDLCGNVWEWCWDWYDKYREKEKENPTGPKTGTNRVLRGGSCLSYLTNIHPESRSQSLPTNRVSCTGIRLVVPAILEQVI